MIQNYTNQSYTLDIISCHPKYTGQTLRKYNVDGIETVGTWGNEPFEIKFKNNTYNKIQIKLSVDGLDILSGELADTQASKKMWLVQGYGTLSLRAWPENNEGGAAFVFTTADNSVARAIQGDLSNRGIIAAAVFVEGHVEPYEVYTPIKGYRRTRARLSDVSDVVIKGSESLSFDDCDSGLSTNYCCNEISDSMNVDRERSLEKLVTVGAGEQVSQNIIYATGLIKPVLSQSLRVRYLWWEDLVKKLSVPADPHPTGFPGDNQEHKILDLKNAPRIKSSGKIKRSAQLSRF